MTKGFHKKPSKRIPAKRRYKIEKKVREHNRKLKKQLKKQNLKHKKGKKDPGIPNSLPFKEQILNEIKELKLRNEEIKETQKLQLKQAKEKKKQQEETPKSRFQEFEELLKNAEKRDVEFENKTQLDEYLINNLDDVDSDLASNTKSFYKDVQKVIESSDILIEVIDARDPLGTRCFEIEEIIKQKYPEKKILLLMNKCDLIPKENLKQWLKYLRRSFITIPFKASTQNQRKNLSSIGIDILSSSTELLQTTKCIGIEFLMKILNNYCHNKDVKTSITVGIIGFPNVGKSSIINSLKRTHVCNVGPTPGLTRSMQIVSLDKKIKLIDSPGIVFAKNPSSSTAGTATTTAAILALRNAVNIEKLKDPILPIEAILNRVNANDLIQIYGLVEFNGVREFLTLIAKRFGKISKGGRMNLESSARKVLHDWNNGKLKYYTIPPEEEEEEEDKNGSGLTTTITIVKEISKPFNLDDKKDFGYDETMEMEIIDQKALEKFSSSTLNLHQSFPIKSFNEIRIYNPQQPQDVTMEDDQQPENSNKKQQKSRQSSSKNEYDVVMEDISDMQLNKKIKTHFKKMKKHQKKSDLRLSNKMDQMNLSWTTTTTTSMDQDDSDEDDGDAYSFENHFYLGK